MKRSYSLEEVAAAHLPADWTDGVRWLRRRLNSGELTGFRVGRTWRMTEEDVEFLTRRWREPVAVEALSAATAPTVESDGSTVVDISFAAGLSERSRRRLARTGS